MILRQEEFVIFFTYCSIRGMGEKPSPLGEDFSMIQ